MASNNLFAFVNSFCVGAISEKTLEISKEIIGVSDKAEENINETKKKLEEALEEYFAALRLLRVDEPNRGVVYTNGTQAVYGEISSPWPQKERGIIAQVPTYTIKNEKHKNIIKKEIEEVYKMAIDNNKAQKTIYNKNIPAEQKIN